MKRTSVLLISAALSLAASQAKVPENAIEPGEAPHSSNPILPGYFADPSVVEFEGHYFIYATLDPGGGQTCFDELTFTDDGLIAKVIPTHQGPELVQNRLDGSFIEPAAITASSQLSDRHAPERATDDNYATRWVPAADDVTPWIQIDLGSSQRVNPLQIRPELTWKDYHFTVESSVDGQNWTVAASFLNQAATGSPIIVESPPTARYFKVSSPTTIDSMTQPSIFEWQVE
ncbi:discoidin domain-containing protein [Pelagicoccus enzymogenes]|uniref:discoidin domain-containing protein n=1 Tax=Pelagicoccus enzymogenes TaxID=2773457 RepID=UPI00280E4D6D|nr:discoidin domain-containing protein [Pelagicoccus enzymogenes]MDQ8199731.1 discoidin domain-containing protein [Pelagicoccus enzymogenes]